MKTNRHLLRAQGGKRGFSLVELLVVICIMTLLLSVATPGSMSLMEGNDVTRAGQIISDQIRLGRQQAAAQSVTVQVRLLQIGSGVKGYNAIQLWDTQNDKALSKVAMLPKNMVISENASLSEFLKTSTIDYTVPTGVPNAGAKYRMLQIGANGFVTPSDEMKTLNMAVVPSRYATEGNFDKAKNFVIVQVNPATGSPLVFRP